MRRLSLRRKFKKWLYGSCPGFAGAFPYYGTKVYFPRHSLLFNLVCEQGIYEYENIKVIMSLMQSNSVFFDIGANIGLMAIPVLSVTGNCKVISFEPSPNTLPFLRKTVEHSNFKGRWEVVDKATGREYGEAAFYIASPNMGAYDGLQDTKRANTDASITVPVTTVDIEWERLGRPVISVIKIDVEGAEFETLLGATDCILGQRPAILLEWNATNLKAYNCPISSLLDFTEQYCYRLYTVPNYNLIADKESLALQMTLTESFLLLPISA